MAWLYTSFVALLAALAVSSVASLLILLLAATRRRPKISPSAGAEPRLAVLIPAHDEELVLASTLLSLRAQDFPADRFEMIVVADNCTDSTAEIARAHGVSVWERQNLAQRGKGWALAWATQKLLTRETPPDAVVIIDADTHAAPDFLTRMADALKTRTDTRGFCAIQGRYGVLNADEGWRAALMAGAFDLFNHVKPLGRDALGLSVGLKGNGMAFTRALLEAAPWRGDRRHRRY